ncbi:Emopamil binding protein-domain-containing protein [Coniochaeta sp. 2T2.1]|nr:Emopamil binding protein-domain-containing protein [Coniochaeta sp. 2T2.1]
MFTDPYLCNSSVPMSTDTGIGHPYFPQDAAIPHYEANTASLAAILRGFVSLIIVFVTSGLYVGRTINPALRKGEMMAMAWFLLCFFLHAFFEGYFVLYHDSLAASQTLFSQLWKEYALSDSRYMTSDPFMLCIESLTVLLWAPLCLAIVVCIIKRSPMRHPLQTIMCVGHLFGVALYYGTCFFEHQHKGISHSRPEFLYYWVYYLGLNAAWFVVPAVYLFQSSRNILFALECSEGAIREARLAGEVVKKAARLLDELEEMRAELKELRAELNKLRPEYNEVRAECRRLLQHT